MNYSKIAWGLVALLAGLGLGACGGGGAGDGGNTATVNNTTVGVITGFGSVYVNGCKYETTSASIFVNGQSGTEDDLSVGDVVEVTGPANCVNGNAISIKYTDELEGVVDSNSVTAGIGTMVVMGQKITVNDLTIFEDKTASLATVNDIASGYVVEISGFGMGTGDIVATRIEVKATNLASYANDIEVKGVVTGLNDVAHTFMIGGLTIDYSSAFLDGISVIKNDLYIEAKTRTYSAGSMTMVATKVELEDDGKIGHQGDTDEEYEIKGMLTVAYDAATKTFGINEQMVLISGNTEFEDITISDLNSGNLGTLYMEVEGSFNANKILVAKEVELEDDDVNDSSEAKGTVSNLNVTDTNNGTLTVSWTTPSAGSVDLTVSNMTMMIDSDGANPETKFNLTHLRDGDFVEVYYDATIGMVIKLEREHMPVS